MFFTKKKDEPIWDKETGLLMHYPAKPEVDEEEQNATTSGEKPKGLNKDLPEVLLNRRMLDCQKFHITLLDGSLHYIQFDKLVGKFLITPGPNDTPYYLSRSQILDNPVVTTTHDGGIVLSPGVRKVGWEPIVGTTMNGYDTFFPSTGALLVRDPMPRPIAPPEMPTIESKLFRLSKCRCKERVQIEGYGIGTMQYDGKVWVLTKQNGKVLARIDNDEISDVCKSFHGNMLYIKNW